VFTNHNPNILGVLYIRDINTKNKAIYIALLLDPRIKRAGLELTGITSGQATDIKTKLDICWK
jgi:hypothetical protein